MKHCEAMVRAEGTWTRCGRNPVEDHHRLTRGRGGAVLDKYGERYHHILLCPRHHRMADGGKAYLNGLLIDGYVQSHPDGRPLYTGTDSYLIKKYGIGGTERLR